MPEVPPTGCAGGVARAELPELRLESYGVRLGIRACAATLKRVETVLPVGWRQTGGDVEHWYAIHDTSTDEVSVNVFKDDELMTEALNLDTACAFLESEIHITVAEAARERIFVHAGVVAWKDRAIVVPGRSYTGKTTLVAELVRTGATYYSDEYAVLDAQGMVHPFPRPLAIRDSSGTQEKWCVESLGGVAGDRPLPADLVVVTHYRSCSTWRPRRLTQGQGILALFDNTVAARSRPIEALIALENMVSRAVILKGPRGDAAETARRIMRRVERRMYRDGRT